MLTNQLEKDIKITLLANPGSKLVPDGIDSIAPGFNLIQGDAIDVSAFQSTDVFLICFDDPEWGWKHVQALRKDERHLIKPVGSLSLEPIEKADELIDEQILLSGDRILAGKQIESLKRLSQESVRFPDTPEGLEANKRREILLLSYLAARTARGQGLRPQVDMTAETGYSYPLVSLFLDYPCSKAHEVLENWEKAKLLQGDEVDRVNLCPHCLRYNLNFREVCPQCGSGRIHEESTVHHFACGYIGFERDFVQGMLWICPKCGKDLRHIGVDYDKPVDNIWCAECRANFSDPALECFCLHCRTTTHPHQLLTKTIKSFYITTVGVRYAQHGSLPELGFVNLLKDDFNLYDIQVFKEYLRIEYLRCQRYKFSSSLVVFQLQNLDELLEQIGVEAIMKIRREIIDILKKDLRNTDLITAVSNHETAFLLPNTPQKDIQSVTHRLIGYFDKAFAHQLQFTYRSYDLLSGGAEVEGFLKNV